MIPGSRSWKGKRRPATAGGVGIVVQGDWPRVIEFNFAWSNVAYLDGGYVAGKGRKVYRFQVVASYTIVIVRS